MLQSVAQQQMEGQLTWKKALEPPCIIGARVKSTDKNK